jgi:hypothetical protein
MAAAHGPRCHLVSRTCHHLCLPPASVSTA